MTTLLRSERARRGLRATDVAEQVGVHPMSVLRWERRERLPGPRHIHALARVLEIEPARVAGFFDDARSRDVPEAERGHRGQGLRTLRWAAGLPAARIADELGVPVSTVYNWESGRARIPAARLAPLARLLAMPPGDLAGRLAGSVGVVAPAPEVSPLRRLRHRSRLSQARAARAAGVDRHSLGAWERGRARPSLGAVRRLARAYGVPAAVVARAAGITPPTLLDRTRWRPGDLPAIVRTLRDWGGLTQGDLADRCGCSAAAVRTWESGRAVPSPRSLGRLEQALNLPAGSLAAVL